MLACAKLDFFPSVKIHGCVVVRGEPKRNSQKHHFVARKRTCLLTAQLKLTFWK